MRRLPAFLFLILLLYCFTSSAQTALNADSFIHLKKIVRRMDSIQLCFPFREVDTFANLRDGKQDTTIQYDRFYNINWELKKKVITDKYILSMLGTAVSNNDCVQQVNLEQWDFTSEKSAASNYQALDSWEKSHRGFRMYGPCYWHFVRKGNRIFFVEYLIETLEAYQNEDALVLYWKLCETVDAYCKEL